MDSTSEIAKALGPWPILQLFFGLLVLGLGVLAIMRGLKGKEPPLPNTHAAEDLRAVWEAYNQLENIETNSWKMVELLTKLLEIQSHMLRGSEAILQIQHQIRDIESQQRDIALNKNQHRP